MAQKAAFVAPSGDTISGINVGGYVFDIEKALEEGKGVIETSSPAVIDACQRAGLKQIDPDSAKSHRK